MGLKKVRIIQESEIVNVEDTVARAKKDWFSNKSMPLLRFWIPA